MNAIVIPILYSFRRCPYAMRARLAIVAAEYCCELREVVLKNKPQALLDASPKATVPVLVTEHRVIDESIDIMRRVIEYNAPKNWSLSELDSELVTLNDSEFKHYLDRYKYFDRFPEHSQDFYFAQARPFLKLLERSLVADDAGSFFLNTPYFSALDSAILPFVRQFAFVDKHRFDKLALPNLQSWLEMFLRSTRFETVMQKQCAWSPQQATPVLFGK